MLVNLCHRSGPVFLDTVYTYSVGQKLTSKASSISITFANIYLDKFAAKRQENCLPLQMGVFALTLCNTT